MAMKVRKLSYCNLSASVQEHLGEGVLRIAYLPQDVTNIWAGPWLLVRL